MFNEEKSEQPVLKVDYFTLDEDVSHGFNVLKAKLYNLAEATFEDGKQLEAFKGLIKDFANDAFKRTQSNIKHHARLMGILPEGTDWCDGAYPLEK
jgi:hypothetical protein